MQQIDFTVCERILSSRWMLSILWNLQQPQRFGTIQARLSGLSRGVLAAQLQELLNMGLVTQTKYLGFPPRVEYCLSEKGLQLTDILGQPPEALAPDPA